MTRNLIVDASVSAKWFIVEEWSDLAVLLLESDAPLHAPDLIALEFAGIVWKKVRQGSLPNDEAARLFDALTQSPMTLHPIEPLVGRALAIGLATGATVYDSMYVALAESQDATLVTADEKLATRLHGTRWQANVLTLRAWAAIQTRL